MMTVTRKASEETAVLREVHTRGKAAIYASNPLSQFARKSYRQRYSSVQP
jgi:hypothetical protein